MNYHAMQQGANTGVTPCNAQFCKKTAKTAMQCSFMQCKKIRNGLKVHHKPTKAL